MVAKITLGILAVLFVLTGVSGSFSETMIECREPKGYGYYFENGFVSASQKGWTEDAITGGIIALELKENSADILFKDAHQLKSASGQGAQVVLTGVGTRTISVSVIYNKTNSEHYVFDLLNKKMAFTSLKFEGFIEKASLMISECK